MKNLSRKLLKKKLTINKIIKNKNKFINNNLE